MAKGNSTPDAVSAKLGELSVLFEALESHHGDLLKRFYTPEHAAMVMFTKLIATDGTRLTDELIDLTTPVKKVMREETLHG